MLQRVLTFQSSIFQWSPKSRSELRPTAWLDGLRGVAAFEVLIYHYVDLWINPEPGYAASPDTKEFFRLPFIRSFYDSGRAMVCTFFIISGFVLTQRGSKLLRKGDLAGLSTSLSSSIFRRGIRLFIPALFPIFMGFILVRLGKRGAVNNDYLPYYDSFWRQVHHWLVETTRYLSVFRWYAQSFGGDLMHKYEAVVWTLPMEFYCSMAIYIIFLLTARLQIKMRRLTVATIAVYSLIQGGWPVFCFCYGLILADVCLDQGLPSISLLASIAWSFALLLGIWIAGAPQRGTYEEHTQALGFNWLWFLMPEHYVTLDINYTGWSMSAILITTSISQLSWPKYILEGAFCQYLGKISFALYLNHVWIRDLLGPKLQWHTLATLTGGGVWFLISWLTWMCLMIPINFMIAGWFEKLIDAPVVLLARRIEEYCISIGKHEYSPIAVDLPIFDADAVPKRSAE